MTYCTPIVCELETYDTLTPENVLEKALLFFEVKKEEIIGRRRNQDLADQRHMTMAVIFHNCRISLQKTGAMFNRDHTTVIHAREKVKDLCYADRSFRERFAQLTHFVKN